MSDIRRIFTSMAFVVFISAATGLIQGCAAQADNGKLSDGDESELDNEPRKAGPGEPCLQALDCRDDLVCDNFICSVPSDGDATTNDGDAETPLDGDSESDDDQPSDGDVVADGDLELIEDGDEDIDFDGESEQELEIEIEEEIEVEEEAIELICNDGIDDDKDGRTDCEDIDCDDRFEPNNSNEQATSVNAETYAEGLVSRSDDPDWYVIAVCNGASVAAEILSAEDLSEFGLVLYHQNGSQVAQGQVSDNRLLANYESSYVGELHINLFVVTENSCLPYALDISADYSNCLPAEICDNGEDDDKDLKVDCDDPDCNDWLEPNDSLESPYVLEDVSASWSNIVISSGNADYYQVYGCSGDVLHVSLVYSENDGDLTLELLNQTGDTLAQGALRSRTRTLELNYPITGSESALILHVSESNQDTCQFYSLQLGGLTAECLRSPDK
jgi:hypothetical protein